MVQKRAARSAAERYAGDMVDVDDPNDRRERALVEDEHFQSLAVAAEQLDLMDIYGDMERHESTFANTASDHLTLALEERAATVLDGADGVESPAKAFDPGDYDNVSEALQEAPNGYGVEKVLDHFDPVVDADSEGDR